MEFHILSIQLFVALIVISFTRYVYKWRNPKCSGKLPPGSSGIPLIGESLQLFLPSYNFDIHPFIRKRLNRYGLLFRTNVAGRNMVVSADQEFNRFLFQQEEKLVVHWYLDSFAKIFKQGELRPDGLVIHKYTRNLVLSHFGAESIRQKLLHSFEDLVHKTLHSWSTKNSIEIRYASVVMYGEFASEQLYSCSRGKSKELIDSFINVTKGAMSFPLNIPGTMYRKSLEEKEKVITYIRDIVEARLASAENNNNSDLLGKMITHMNKEEFLTKEFVTQLLFGLSYATFDTIPPILMFALKFISENPAVLQELTAEHEDILKKRKNPDTNMPITWQEYKSMSFTLMVINESLRLGNTLPGFLRKAIKDIQVQGYTIPAGWGIMVCHSALHLDPNLYKDPLTFNPWRWKGVDREFISKNLIPFGNGLKQCAGADYVRASLSIFLHVLVTKYRWKVVKAGHIVQNPILQLKNGLYINFSKLSI